MKPSAMTIATARVVLAKAMLTNHDPRLRKAFDELRQCLVEDEQLSHDSTRELIANSRTPMLTQRQAG
jgi:hypothetical protein